MSSHAYGDVADGENDFVGIKGCELGCCFEAQPNICSGNKDRFTGLLPILLGHTGTLLANKRKTIEFHLEHLLRRIYVD